MYIGIDVGGTKIKGIVFDKGQILKSVKVMTPKTSEGFVNEIVDVTKELYDHYKNIKGIGICFPGAVDREKGSVISMPSLPNVNNVEIKKIFKRHFKVPVRVENDGKCAAIAEFLYGYGKGKRTIIALTIGTGIGGGTIVNETLCIGRGNGGEVGHLTIDPHGLRCACGRIGCFEEYAASRGVMRMAKQMKIKAENPLDIENLARRGDKKAMQLYNKVGYYLGIGIGDLIKVFDPEIITLSGSIANAYDVFAKSMNKEIDNTVFFKHCEIKISRIKDAPSVGAASLFEFYENYPRLKRA